MTDKTIDGAVKLPSAARSITIDLNSKKGIARNISIASTVADLFPETSDLGSCLGIMASIEEKRSCNIPPSQSPLSANELLEKGSYKIPPSQSQPSFKKLLEHPIVEAVCNIPIAIREIKKINQTKTGVDWALAVTAEVLFICPQTYAIGAAIDIARTILYDLKGKGIKEGALCLAKTVLSRSKAIPSFMRGFKRAGPAIKDFASSAVSGIKTFGRWCASWF